jgi:Ca-activated chloride channel homolog
MSKLSRHLALFAVLLLVFSSATSAARADKALAKEQAKRIAELPEVYRTWLAEVEVLITPTEIAAFLEIAEDYQRDAFIERFWEVRDPYPDTGRNELRERWQARLEQVRRFGGLSEDRAKFFLLNGSPDAILQPRCAGVIWPLEIWFYNGSEKIREKFFVYFVQRFGLGPYRRWDPVEGVASLLQFGGASEGNALAAIAQGCANGDEVAGALSWGLRQGQMAYSMLLAKLEAPPERPAGEWIGTFASQSTELPEGSVTFPATLELRYPARRQNRTVAQGILGVAVADAGRAEINDSRTYNFLLTGEVLRGRKLFESFRYKFDFPAADVAGPMIPMVFERFLRPGSYSLIVKLEDLNSKKFFRQRLEIEVPGVEGPEQPMPMDAETARLLAEANAAIRSGENTLRIIRPTGELQTGLVRFDALTTGVAPARVAFTLNNKPLLTKKSPPWSVELDLGTLPRTHLLRVTSFDAAAEELATDEIQVNAGSHRFAVRLIEPRRGRTYTQSLRAEAEVELPEGQRVERVEFFLNETKVATLFQPPYTQPIVLPPGNPVAYVRAVAYLPDGNSTERIVFINSPDYLEEVEVQFVEAFATVVDRSGRPVADLGKEDFQVFEDGQLQTVLRFERVENLPVHAAILLDTSASMEPNLAAAQVAALRFFQQTTTPKDRAAVITFNDRPTLAVKLTNDLASLAGGLAGLKAERGTALWDSVVFSLFYFNGVKGQRALLVLSDGKDEVSRFTFDETLDYARRAGVAIYAVGLGFERGDREAKKQLTRLAEETGARSFFVESVAELDAIYADIQKELRSRYLLAYQSANTSGSEKFRAVEIKAVRPGLEVKAMRGYYP